MRRRVVMCGLVMVLGVAVLWTSDGSATSGGAEECANAYHPSGRSEVFGHIERVEHQRGEAWDEWDTETTLVRGFRRKTNKTVKDVTIRAKSTVLCYDDRIELWHSARAFLRLARKKAGQTTQVGYALLEGGSLVELGDSIRQLRGAVTYQTWDHDVHIQDGTPIVTIEWGDEQVKVVANRSTFRVKMGDDCGDSPLVLVGDQGDVFSPEQDPHRSHGVLLARTNSSGETEEFWVEQGKAVLLKPPDGRKALSWVQLIQPNQKDLHEELKKDLDESHAALHRQLMELRERGELRERPPGPALTPPPEGPMRLIVFSKTKPSYVYLDDKQILMSPWRNLGKDVWVAQTRNELPDGPHLLEVDRPNGEKLRAMVEDVSPPATREEAPTPTDKVIGPCGGVVSGGPTGMGHTARANNAGAMRFVGLSDGSFCMGTPLGVGNTKGDELPNRSVTVSGFYIAESEVTHLQWREVLSMAQVRADVDFEKLPLASNDPKDNDLPIGKVSWCDAVVFANVLSRLEGLTPVYEIDPAGCEAGVVWTDTSGGGYRLPTEAEWEYAARAGAWTEYPHGDSVRDICAYGNVKDTSFNELVPGTPKGVCRDRFAKTSPVCSFEKNAWGLCDLSGNVWEWTWDWYSQGGYDDVSNDDPRGVPYGTAHTLRGGSFYAEADRARSAHRESASPGLPWEDVGFRLVVR